MKQRDYLTDGKFVPNMAPDYPECQERLHRDSQHAVSDVLEAFTCNAHLEKMRIIDKKDMIEQLNRAALSMTKKAAADVQADMEYP